MASIEALNTIILLGALLVLAGILSSLIASRFGAPLLLFFLGIGMLAGEDGLGHIAFADYRTTYLVGSLALAVILFDGGMRTKVASFRVALRPALVLATFGVLITAVLTGACALLVFELTLPEALLLGSIVASTDAAAVFFLLRTGGLQLSERVGLTLEIESSTNDPFAIFLTLMLVNFLEAQSAAPGLDVIVLFIEQAAIGTVLGAGGGLLISVALNRLELPSGLQPLFVSTAAVLVFAAAGRLGGSGYLAVYFAGLVVGNRPIRGFAGVTSFQDAATWLFQIIMFLVLGLLATPSRLLEYALPALAVAFGLMLVARPVATVICLLPFRFSLAETAFVGWVGLRGAVSIFLASVPMLTGMQHAEFFFNVAFAVVIASLVVQGWTVAPVARWLDVTLPRVHHPVSRVELDLPGQLEYEIVGYEVPADGAILQQAAPPAWARLLLIARGERVLAPGEAGALRPGDYAYLLAPPWRAHLLDRLFAPSDEIAESDRDFFGEFVFGGEVRLAVLAALYGLPAPADAADSTIAEFFRERMSEHPVVGDRLPLGGSALIVRELDGDRVTQVGLRLEAPARPHRFAWLRRLLDRRLRREAPGAAPPAAASGASLREDPSESR